MALHVAHDEAQPVAVLTRPYIDPVPHDLFQVPEFGGAAKPASRVDHRTIGEAGQRAEQRPQFYRAPRQTDLDLVRSGDDERDVAIAFVNQLRGLHEGVEVAHPRGMANLAMSLIKET